MPLYILGSSLFGATLAAALGLPYAFASHFAPAALHDAVAAYRREFRPSEQLAEPYVIAGVNVDRRRHRRGGRAAAAGRACGPGVRPASRPRRHLTDEEADELLASPGGPQLAQMMHLLRGGHAGRRGGVPRRVRGHADADELIVAFQSPTVEGRLRSLELVAAELQLGTPST